LPVCFCGCGKRSPKILLFYRRPRDRKPTYFVDNRAVDGISNTQVLEGRRLPIARSD